MTTPVTIAITGTGQVSYALAFRIASGAMLGTDVPVRLRLFEIPEAASRVEALAMELDDGAFPALRSVHTTTDYFDAFDGASWVFLIGSIRRTADMTRGDLLRVNGESFRTQGRAVAERAAPDVRIIVVGNPSNTNCLIARSNAPEVPAERWAGMMRLDANRARSFLADRAGVSVDQVTNVTVWGNHSETQFPDGHNARIAGRPAPDVIDPGWLEGEFVDRVQNRGRAIIDGRGASSGASAAQAALDSARAQLEPSGDDWTSLAVVSRGEYGVPEGLQFGFPVRVDVDGWTIASGLELTPFARERLAVTIAELESEREAVRDLIPS